MAADRNRATLMYVSCTLLRGFHCNQHCLVSSRELLTIKGDKIKVGLWYLGFVMVCSFTKEKLSLNVDISFHFQIITFLK